MPIDYAEYPPEWKAISLRIRNERAQGRCECEGECRKHVGRCTAINRQPHPVTGSRVVLTVAHYPDPTKSNVADENLHAWCQRCHLAVDAVHHATNRKYGRHHAGPHQHTLPLDSPVQDVT